MDRPFGVRGKVVEDNLFALPACDLYRAQGLHIQWGPEERQTLTKSQHPLMVLVELSSSRKSAEGNFLLYVDDEGRIHSVLRLDTTPDGAGDYLPRSSIQIRKAHLFSLSVLAQMGKTEPCLLFQAGPCLHRGAAIGLGS